jgi:hypothetical protein
VRELPSCRPDTRLIGALSVCVNNAARAVEAALAHCERPNMRLDGAELIRSDL